MVYALACSLKMVQLVAYLGPNDAADTLVSYAFGSYEWTRNKRWERMSL